MGTRSTQSNEDTMDDSKSENSPISPMSGTSHQLMKTPADLETPAADTRTSTAIQSLEELENGQAGSPESVPKDPMSRIPLHVAKKLVSGSLVTLLLLNGLRLVPIILGSGYQTIVPLMFTNIALFAGWYGRANLSPRWLARFAVLIIISNVLDVIVDATIIASVYKGLKLPRVENRIITYIIIFGILINQFICFVTSLILRHKITYLLRDKDFLGEIAFSDLLEKHRKQQQHMEAFREIIFTGPLYLPKEEAQSSEFENDYAANKTNLDPKQSVKRDHFISNEIVTSKYTFYNFLFIFLKLQFSRVANFYTFVVVILCFFSFSPVSPAAALVPLLIVFVSAGIKDLSEDFKRRRADAFINGKVTQVLVADADEENDEAENKRQKKEREFHLVLTASSSSLKAGLEQEKKGEEQIHKRERREGNRAKPRNPRAVLEEVQKEGVAEDSASVFLATSSSCGSSLQSGLPFACFPCRWKDVAVGDIILLSVDDVVPADILLLATSREEDGLCYIETANLDGENNLKVRSAPKDVFPLFRSRGALNETETANECNPEEWRNCKFALMCGAPSANLFEFEGTLTLRTDRDETEPSIEQQDTVSVKPDVEFGGSAGCSSQLQKIVIADTSRSSVTHDNLLTSSNSGNLTTSCASKCIVSSITAENMLWRGTQLRSTRWAIGLVVYTGSETRIEQNAQLVSGGSSSNGREKGWKGLLKSLKGGKKTNAILKRTQVELRLNVYLVFLLLVLLALSLWCTIGNSNFLSASASSSTSFSGPQPRTSTPTSETIGMAVESTLADVEAESVRQSSSTPWYLQGTYTSAVNEDLVASNPDDLAATSSPTTVKKTTTTTTNGGDDFIFVSFVILFNSIIPLSLYVTMEGVRFVFARYIDDDIEMYDIKLDTCASTRNSNIPEDLGQIEYIFSDKTGTLTCNEMLFAQCSIAGVKYGDVDEALESRASLEGDEKNRMFSQPTSPPVSSLPEGTRFNDSRILDRLNSGHPAAESIHQFLLFLSLCNTVVPQQKGTNGAGSNARPSRLNTIDEDEEHKDYETDRVDRIPEPEKYQAASPDELCLVQAAKHIGYVLLARSADKVYLKRFGKVEQWTVLNILEFDSDRKRMSSILRDPNGRIWLLCKGADAVMFPRLSPECQELVKITESHLQEYATIGLRTLTMGIKELNEDEYNKWNSTYQRAANALVDRKRLIDEAAEMIETNFRLVGASAVEDRLQDDVNDTIRSIREAGIKFWVLTGDKQETAISIGFSTDTIDDSMELLILNERSLSLLQERLLRLRDELFGPPPRQDKRLGARIMEMGLSAIRWLMNFMREMMFGYKDSQTGRERDKQLINENRQRERDSVTNFSVQRVPAPAQPALKATMSAPALRRPGRGSFASKTISDQAQAVKLEDTGNRYSVESVAASATSEPVSASKRKKMTTFFEAEDPLQSLHQSGGPAQTLDSDSRISLEYGMVIDGPTLKLALESNLRLLFATVARECRSVICCRCSPAQKAEVVQLLTSPSLLMVRGSTGLAIGDGANDVPMILAANVGVGISGKEGRQATLNSDFSISQFRHLKRLLLVHGALSYFRVTRLILFSIMKNVALTFSIFFFARQSKFSGQLPYFDALFTFYNALFTTIPIVVVSMVDRHLSTKELMKNPRLYQRGRQGRDFATRNFVGWFGLGIWHASVIFFVPFFSANCFYTSWNESKLYCTGPDAGLHVSGLSAYTHLIMASTAQVALLVCSWSMHALYAVGGTILIYVAIILLLCSVSLWIPSANILGSQEARHVIQELLPRGSFWLSLLVTTFVAVLPYLVRKAYKDLFQPEDVVILREVELKEKQKRKQIEADQEGEARSHKLPRTLTGFAFAQEAGEATMILNAGTSLPPASTDSSTSYPFLNDVFVGSSTAAPEGETFSVSSAQPLVSTPRDNEGTI